MMKIKPRGQWCLVKPLEKEGNKNGLVIPDNVERDKKSYGEVMEVGDKVVGLKRGAKVLYGRYAGEEIMFSNREEHREVTDLILLLEEDILATIE